MTSWRSQVRVLYRSSGPGILGARFLFVAWTRRPHRRGRPTAANGFGERLGTERMGTELLNAELLDAELLDAKGQTQNCNSRAFDGYVEVNRECAIRFLGGTARPAMLRSQGTLPKSLKAIAWAWAGLRRAVLRPLFCVRSSASCSSASCSFESNTFVCARRRRAVRRPTAPDRDVAQRPPKTSKTTIRVDASDCLA